VVVKMVQDEAVKAFFSLRENLRGDSRRRQRSERLSSELSGEGKMMDPVEEGKKGTTTRKLTMPDEPHAIERRKWRI
jgi:hypothetical protein